MTLSIIIVNHNTKELLRQTINSISADLEYEIIVVDNASTDGSIEMLETQYASQITLIKNPHNTGFAAANNLGIKQSTGRYILLLNSDTKIIDNALNKLVKFLTKHQQVGIVTPKLVLADGAIDLACHRGFPSVSNSLAYFLGLESFFPNFRPLAGYHQTYKDFNYPHQIDAVSGAAMLIKRKVFDQIGFLDERFFMYAEDIDFCLRAKSAGWQIYYYPKAKVIHFKG